MNSTPVLYPTFVLCAPRRLAVVEHGLITESCIQTLIRVALWERYDKGRERLGVGTDCGHRHQLRVDIGHRIHST